MAEKTNANIGFENKLWEAACVLWGHIPTTEYRQIIIGLIFLRYISNAFDKKYQELVEEGDGFEDDRDAYMMDNIFFVPEEARWNIISANAHSPEIGIVIDKAMRAIEAENKTLKGVLPKNFANPELDKRVLGEVVDIFTNIDIYYYMTTSDFQGEMDGRATGTTVVGLRQPELMKCAICCPDLSTQKRIASLLGSIDAKINTNSKINDNLAA